LGRDGGQENKGGCGGVTLLFLCSLFRLRGATKRERWIGDFAVGAAGDIPGAFYPHWAGAVVKAGSRISGFFRRCQRW